jgi:hypothetical protein
MEGLVKKGLLRARTEVMEWLVPGNKDAPTPPDGYVVSFIPFHERSLMTPAHQFLHRLLHYYGLELQHLNPNGIQHISAFVALCEGVFRDRAPLRDLEVLLRHRATAEKEGQEGARPRGSDRVREHPSSGWLSVGVHVHPLVKIEQGVA